MNSTTETKKNLIDFLWEWAESNGEWSKLLIIKIVAAEKALGNSERRIVFDYFLESIKMNKGLAALAIKKPAYNPTFTKLELTSISDIKGVNKLAENQTIDFGKNLSIIYGENGSGKTGYCRILKSLGFSYDIHNKIYCDINTRVVEQTASINYRTGETTKLFNWNGKDLSSDLSSISVFNNNCVQISLNDGRNLIVTPIGFHLFNLVANELTELEILLNEAISNRPTNLPWKINLNPQTPQSQFINTLSAKSNESELTDLSDFQQNQQIELEEKEIERRNLNITLIEKEIKDYTAQIEELNKLIANIQLAEQSLNPLAWEKYKKLNILIKALENETRAGINEIATAKGVKFFETNEFRHFIESAEQYIKLLKKINYPNDDNEICVYCHQKLNTGDSRELLTSYHRLLNDDNQEKLRENKVESAKFCEIIALLDTTLLFHYETFGRTEKQEIIQPKEILDYYDSINKFKKLVKNNQFEDTECDINYKNYLNFFIGFRNKLAKSLLDKNQTLQNIGDREKILKNQIDELTDRKILSKNVEEIKKVIIYHKGIERLEKNRNKFSTSAISRKTTEAREKLVKQNFINIFNEELKRFKKSNIKIDLNFGTSKGFSKIQQKIKSNYILSEILSEGEQKTIALAEYLTELQLDNSKSPVVFDDPVNSLDHHIIDDVARRLMELSVERQVVICTHSILLFNSLMHLNKLATFKGLDNKFYNSKTQYDRTGYITNAEEEINSVKTLIAKINTILNNSSKDRDESDVASDGYSHLRSAIELCVEHEIFNGTVKRYQKNIALTNFLKVKGELLNIHKDKLNEIFERCCGYINAHSNPQDIQNEPTLNELKTDLKDFNIIRDTFIAN